MVAGPRRSTRQEAVPECAWRWSHQDLRLGGHDGAAVGVALPVAGLDEQVAQLSDVAAQVLLVDRGRRPELICGEVIAADDGIIFRSARQDAEVILETVE